MIQNMHKSVYNRNKYGETKEWFGYFLSHECGR